MKLKMIKNYGIELSVIAVVIIILFLLSWVFIPDMTPLIFLKGLAGIPLLSIVPGWIWANLFLDKKEKLTIRLAYSFMISIVIIGWSVYALRAFFFSSITNLLIILALILVIGSGLIANLIKSYFIPIRSE
ncbi:MAG: hypothetical protein UT55_C0084G0014 [Candidatus Peregrinibacteria bacterium GW2011_GWE2_39_6]|nr:MAG: hypothetical protein UT55_C0084G0014 [Candidatus Peregrinibacteria bacterium GW2011_GWE2_39_6]